MNYIIKEYIKNITEKDIVNFAEKEGIKLLNDEVKIIYMYIKNYWEVLLNQDSTFIFEELKELYAKRWSIETGFKKLKSQIQIEEFSGHKRVNYRTRFLC